MIACEVCGAEPAGFEVRRANLDIWVRLCFECFKKHALAFRTSPLAVKSPDTRSGGSGVVDGKRLSQKTPPRKPRPNRARRRGSGECTGEQGSKTVSADLGDSTRVAPSCHPPGATLFSTSGRHKCRPSRSPQRRAGRVAIRAWLAAPRCAWPGGSGWAQRRIAYYRGPSGVRVGPRRERGEYRGLRAGASSLTALSARGRV